MVSFFFVRSFRILVTFDSYDLEVRDRPVLMPNPDSLLLFAQSKRKNIKIIHQFKNINMFSTKSITSNSFGPEILALSRSGQELLAKIVRMTFLHEFPYFA